MSHHLLNICSLYRLCSLHLEAKRRLLLTLSRQAHSRTSWRTVRSHDLHVDSVGFAYRGAALFVLGWAALAFAAEGTDSARYDGEE